jgi:AcrR family transcriptional regulator
VSAPPQTTGDPAVLLSERSAETRRRILDAAATCFVRYGFGRTRVDDVARAAGVSRALVYGYFASKPRLLRAVQEDAIAEWFARVERAVARAQGSEGALAAWLRMSLAESEFHPLLRALFADEAVAASAHWEEVSARAREAWLARLAELLRRGMEAGRLRPDLDVEATAAVLRAMHVGLIQQVHADPPRVSVARDRQIEAAVEIMLAGIRTGEHR